MKGSESVSQLTNFTYEGQSMEAVSIDGEPWFVAASVSRILNYRSAPDMTRRLDESDKGYAEVRTPGGIQKVTVINESGLYDSIFRSNSIGAKPFRRWVTAEVLPQIRKTGSYSATPALSEDQIVAQALQITTAKIKELEPKAEAYDVFLSAEGDYSARDAAQILTRDHGIKVGQNRLFRWMREHGWIDGGNQPYQNRVDQGVLRIKPGTFRFTRTNGQEQLAPPQVRVTPKGLERLRAEIKEVA